MDPVTAIGLAAGIAQLIDYTAKVIKYVGEVKDAAKERDSLGLEAANLIPLLMNLKYRVETAQSGDPWYSNVRSLGAADGPISQLQTSMELLVVRLKSRRKKLGSSFVWPSDKNECLSILYKIERIKTVVGLALQDDHFKLTLALKDNLGGISTAVEAVTANVAELHIGQEAKVDQEILDWLSTLTFLERQNDIFKKITPGTVDWVLDTPEFQSVLKTNEKILWCPGIPGAGKTVLTSYIVDHLNCKYSQDNVGVAYIYCNHKEVDQTASNLTASLLRQLLQNRPVLSDEIKAVHSSHRAKGTRPSMAEYLSSLRNIVKTFTKSFVLIDALDECKEQDGTRDNLVEVIKQISQVAHIIITSRWSPIFETHLSEAMRLEVRASDGDVAKYIKSRIITTPRLQRHVQADPTLEGSLIERIVGKCHGMFLLAQLHMDSLSKQPHRKAIRLALESLPIELDDTYTDALLRIRSQDVEDTKIAHQVISWVTHAMRPLTVREIQHALSVEPHQSDLDEEAMIDEELLISVCLGLITLDETLKELRLIHYTAQRYFERIRLEHFPDPQKRIASSCLTYLGLKAVREADHPWYRRHDRDLLLPLALLDYAGQFWGFHCHGAESNLEAQILNFLNPRASFLSTRLMIGGVKTLVDYVYEYPYWGGRGTLHRLEIPGILMAAHFGLPYIAQRLLDRVNIDGPVLGLKEAIHPAVSRGHSNLVQLFLDHDADINQFSVVGKDTPLQIAAEEGHFAITKLLIKNEANVEKRYGDDMRKKTPLQLAVEKGHLAIVQALLEAGADPNALYDAYHTFSKMQTPLFLAASNGHTAIAEALLDSGADIDYPKTGLLRTRATALYTAIERGGQEAMVALFLQRGVNLDPEDSMPLKAAIKGNQHGIVSILLEHGANVRKGGLFHGLRYGKDEEMMMMLLRLGANLDACDENGVTAVLSAVLCAILYGDDGTVDFLLKAGANPNLGSIGGSNALSFAVLWGLESIIRVLLAHKADPGAFSTEELLQRAASAKARRESVGEREFMRELGEDPVAYYQKLLSWTDRR